MPNNRSNSKAVVQLIAVREENLGQRLDNFLFRLLKGVPKSRIYKGLRKGEFRVNGGRAKAIYRISTGDLIRIPPLSRDEGLYVKNSLNSKLIDKLFKNVIFEDSKIMVLNKPSGIAVHGGSGLNFGLIEGLRHVRGHNEYLELVHRLDRETSGLILLAKTPATLKHLHLLFREFKVKKKYIALVKGKWPRATMRVEAPIKKNVDQFGERKSIVCNAGKPAITDFRVLRRYANCTLVEATPMTGRTHQIRVHSQHIGNPIVGDERYTLNKYPPDSNYQGYLRLFLHSHHISFTMDDGTFLEFTSELDHSLNRLLKLYTSVDL